MASEPEIKVVELSTDRPAVREHFELMVMPEHLAGGLTPDLIAAVADPLADLEQQERERPQSGSSGGDEWSHTLGVSAIVRFRRPVCGHPAGTLAMVVGQAANGRNRMSVMVPGDSMAYSPLVTDLEVVQGIEPKSWWKRQSDCGGDRG